MTQYEMNCLVERTAKRVVELLRQESMVATENVMNRQRSISVLVERRYTISVQKAFCRIRNLEVG